MIKQLRCSDPSKWITSLCFFDSESYEDCIRNVLYLGGDTDTIACMAGGIAQAYYKNIPQSIIEEVYSRLDKNLIKVLVIVCHFDKRVFRNIFKKLIKKGFLKKQILQINY